MGFGINLEVIINFVLCPLVGDDDNKGVVLEPASTAGQLERG